MKKKLIVFACFLLVSLSCLPQLPVRLNERSVVLNTSTGALKGKMVTPNQESGYPVVLIIPGSGPTDMDGNSAALPGKNNSLKYLAEGLAGKGIASLRYDKRGIASSASAGKDEYSMRFEDGIKDARGWIDYLSRDKRISGIYVLGHSEGALVGMAASVDNPKVKGYISVAGAGRPAYEIVGGANGGSAGSDPGHGKVDKCVLEGREARTGRADRLTILVPFVGTDLYDLMVYV